MKYRKYSSLNCSDWKIDLRLGNLMGDHLTNSPSPRLNIFFWTGELQSTATC